MRKGIIILIMLLALTVLQFGFAENTFSFSIILNDVDGSPYTGKVEVHFSEYYYDVRSTTVDVVDGLITLERETTTINGSLFIVPYDTTKANTRMLSYDRSIVTNPKIGTLTLQEPEFRGVTYVDDVATEGVLVYGFYSRFKAIPCFSNEKGEVSFARFNDEKTHSFDVSGGYENRYTEKQALFDSDIVFSINLYPDKEMLKVTLKRPNGDLYNGNVLMYCFTETGIKELYFDVIDGVVEYDLARTLDIQKAVFLPRDGSEANSKFIYMRDINTNVINDFGDVYFTDTETYAQIQVNGVGYKARPTVKYVSGDYTYFFEPFADDEGHFKFSSPVDIEFDEATLSARSARIGFVTETVATDQDNIIIEEKALEFDGVKYSFYDDPSKVSEYHLEHTDKNNIILYVKGDSTGTLNTLIIKPYGSTNKILFNHITREITSESDWIVLEDEALDIAPITNPKGERITFIDTIDDEVFNVTLIAYPETMTYDNFISGDVDETNIDSTLKPYIAGYDDKTFRPDGLVTRAEIATMFCKALNLDLVHTGSPKYSDVDEEHWSYNYVQTIDKTGLFGGYDDGTFKPDKTISRAEIAQVFTNYWIYIGKEVSDEAIFERGINHVHWAAAPTYRLFNERIITDKVFDPDENMTRGETVKMINLILGKRPIKPEKESFTDVDSTNVYYEHIEGSIAE